MQNRNPNSFWNRVARTVRIADDGIMLGLVCSATAGLLLEAGKLVGVQTEDNGLHIRTMSFLLALTVQAAFNHAEGFANQVQRAFRM